MPELSEYKKTIKRVIAAVIFSASVWYVAASFQWSDILAILTRVNPGWILVALSTIIAFWLIRTMRWYFLLKRSGVTIPFKDLYICSAAALGFAIITPFQSGELLKIEMLKKGGQIQRIKGYSSFAIERFCDVAVLLSITGVAVFVFLNSGDRRTLLWVLAAMANCLICVVFILWKVTLPGRAGRFQHELRQYLGAFSVWMSTMTLTVLCWAMVTVGWYFCFAAIGVNVGFFNTFMLTATATIINVASFVPGAVGVSEAGISFLLVQLGQTQALAQAGAIVLRLYAILILICGAGHYLVWRKLNSFTAIGYSNHS
jgi:uncharacterized membrane protein YbhN (UPF0104 family)